VCDDYDVRGPSIMFVLKCQFKKSPFSFLGLNIVCFGLLLAYNTRIFERAYYNTHPIIDSTMNW